MDDYEVTFGTWLRQKLNARGWSQRRLAQMIGASTGMMSGWAGDKRRPEPGNVAKIAAALGVPEEEALTRAGYEVRPTGNLSTMWNWVSRGEGDLLITDVVMPEMSGPQLAVQMRQHHPGVPVLFMSGYSDGLLAARGVPVHGQVKFVPSMRNVFSLVPEPNADTVVTVPLEGEVAAGAVQGRQDLRVAVVEQEKAERWADLEQERADGVAQKAAEHRGNGADPGDQPCPVARRQDQ